MISTNKKRSKYLSLLIVLAMMFTLMAPMTVFAENGEEGFITLTGTNYESLKEAGLTFTVSYQDHDDYDKLGVVTVTGTITQAQLEEANLVLNDQDQVALTVWVKAPEGAHSLTGGGYENATTWDNTDGAGYWSTLNLLFVRNGEEFELVDVYEGTLLAGEHVGLSSFDVKWFVEDSEEIVHQAITIDARTVSITEAPEVDKDALVALIGTAETLKAATGEGEEPGQAPATAHTAFQTAIDAAKAVNTNEEATQEQVNTAVTDLQAAIEAFEEAIVEANLTAYTAALAAVVESNYTADSWTAYQVVVAANVVTVANTQEEVTTATGNITTAQGSLVTVVDANLAAAKAAEAALTSTDYADYSAVTTALAMTEGTDAEKIAKTTAINDAIAALEEVVEADLTAYTAALAAVVESDYTADSWTAYQVVVAANVVTVANTQEEVDAATAAITTAIDGLVYVAGHVGSITTANTLLVGDYAFELNVANNNYNLNNYLIAAQTAYSANSGAQYHIYYYTGSEWYDLVVDSELDDPITNLKTINGDGGYAYTNMTDN